MIYTNQLPEPDSQLIGTQFTIRKTFKKFLTDYLALLEYFLKLNKICGGGIVLFTGHNKFKMTGIQIPKFKSYLNNSLGYYISISLSFVFFVNKSRLGNAANVFHILFTTSMNKKTVELMLS